MHRFGVAGTGIAVLASDEPFAALDVPAFAQAPAGLPAPVTASAASILDAYGGGWSAWLQARVSRVAERSVLSASPFRGPLRLQKALWPEGADPAHLILLHPPGGIAAGDALSLEFLIDEDAHALVTTPGAGRWYRADAECTQTVQIEVERGASIEWLPQEVVVHDGAWARAETEVRIARGGCALGLEATVFGRRESGERFLQGRLRQQLRISLDGQLLLDDLACIEARQLTAAPVLGTHHASGLLWAVRENAFDEPLCDAVLESLGEEPGLWCGVSAPEKSLLLVRVVASHPERLMRALRRAWACLRPQVTGRAAQFPRIWMT